MDRHGRGDVDLVIAVVISAIERTSHVEEISRREVRIAELEATTATATDKGGRARARQGEGRGGRGEAETERKARAKAVVDAISAALKPESARGDARSRRWRGRVRIELSDRLRSPTSGDRRRQRPGGARALGAALAGLGDRTFDVVGHSDTKEPKGYDELQLLGDLVAARERGALRARGQGEGVPKKLTASGKGVTSARASARRTAASRI